MIGYADSPDKLITNAFKQGDIVFLIGRIVDNNSNVGGSLYQRVLYDFLGGKVDEANSDLERQLKDTIFELRDKKLLSGCNDISEGGAFGAIFESLRAGNVGFDGCLVSTSDHEKSFFGEINGRYIISTSKPDEVISVLKKNNIKFAKIGVCTENTLKIDNYSFDLQKLFKLYDNAIKVEIEE